MKNGKFSFSPILFLLGLSVAALAAWALSHFSGLSFWIAFPIVVAAMLINGFIADVEDNAPGGFNNPLPPDKSEPAEAVVSDRTPKP